MLLFSKKYFVKRNKVLKIYLLYFFCLQMKNQAQYEDIENWEAGQNLDTDSIGRKERTLLPKPAVGLLSSTPKNYSNNKLLYYSPEFGYLFPSDLAPLCMSTVISSNKLLCSYIYMYATTKHASYHSYHTYAQLQLLYISFILLILLYYSFSVTVEASSYNHVIGTYVSTMSMYVPHKLHCYITNDHTTYTTNSMRLLPSML